MEVLNLQDGRVDRDELARYMANFVTENQYTFEDWRARLKFYWDLNPVHDLKGPTGWALVEKGRICGFLGAIQTRYQNSQGEIKPGLSATSWRVDPEFRSQSMLLFMKYMQAKKEFLLIDTTPTPDVEKILSAFKFEGPYLSNNFLWPLGQSAVSRGFWGFVTPPAWSRARGERLTRDRLRNLQVDFRPPAGFFERRIDRELLDWYAFEGIREKHLYGLVEGSNLVGYILFLKEIFRSLPILRAVDFQFKPEARGQYQSLLTRVAEGAGKEYKARVMIMTTFAGHPEQKYFSLTLPNKKKYDQHHYLFRTPALWPGLKWAPKMFDGDYGC